MPQITFYVTCQQRFWVSYEIIKHAWILKRQVSYLIRLYAVALNFLGYEHEQGTLPRLSGAPYRNDFVILKMPANLTEKISLNQFAHGSI